MFDNFEEDLDRIARDILDKLKESPRISSSIVDRTIKRHLQELLLKDDRVQSKIKATEDIVEEQLSDIIGQYKQLETAMMNVRYVDGDSNGAVSRLNIVKPVVHDDMLPRAISVMNEIIQPKMPTIDVRLLRRNRRRYVERRLNQYVASCKWFKDNIARAVLNGNRKHMDYILQYIRESLEVNKLVLGAIEKEISSQAGVVRNVQGLKQLIIDTTNFITAQKLIPEISHPIRTQRTVGHGALSTVFLSEVKGRETAVKVVRRPADSGTFTTYTEIFRELIQLRYGVYKM